MNIDKYIQHWARQILKESEDYDYAYDYDDLNDYFGNYILNFF